MKIHPAAEVFPMLTDDELDQLAKDIKKNGQLHPVIMDGDVLIDGRNRVSACERAGVDVDAEELGDRDVETVILSANVSRRHLTVGQRAMGVVLVKARTITSNASRRRSGGRLAVLAAAGVSESSLRNAEYVHEHAPDLIDQVMAGASLKEAYRVARDRQKEKEDAEKQAEQRLGEIEQERQELLAAIEAARDEIGPAVKVPPEPELRLQFTPGPKGEKIAFPEHPLLGDSLKREDRLLKKMLAIKRDILALTEEEVIEDIHPLEHHVMAVRSWASNVTKPIYEWVEKHNEALENSKTLRRVQ